MSQMKKMIELFESYDKLPKSKFKEDIKEDMKKIKKAVNYDEYKKDEKKVRAV